MSETNQLAYIYDECVKNFEATNFTNLRTYAAPDRDLEGILRFGDEGISLLSGFLWHNVKLEGDRIIMEAPADRIDSEWIKKERIIEAFAKTDSDVAFKSIAPLLLAHKADEIFNDRIIYAVEKAVVCIKGAETKQALAEVIDVTKMHPQTADEIDGYITSFESGFTKKPKIEYAAQCAYCGSPLDDDAEFCVQCGMPVRGEGEIPQAEMPRVQMHQPLISAKKYAALYIWTMINIFIGCLPLAIVSIWQMRKMVFADTKEQAEKHAKYVIIINVISNLIGILAWLYVLNIFKF